MARQKLITEIKSTSIDDLIIKSKSLWIDHNQSKIDKEASDEVQKRKEEIKQKIIAWATLNQVPPQNSKTSNTNNINNLPITDFYGIQVYSHIRCPHSQYVDESGIKSNITKKYEQEFDTKHKTGLSNYLSKQLDNLNAMPVLDALFKRHPWIERDLSEYKVKQSLAHIFLSPIYQNAITSNAPYPLNCDYKYWSWTSLVKAQTQNDQWKALSVSNYEKNIAGFPLSDIRAHYFTYQPNLTHLSNSYDPVNYHLSRLDVYRLLYTNHGSKTVSQTANGIAICEAAPFISTELVHLSDVELSKLQIMMVNISSEDSPEWICLKKSYSTRWDVYTNTQQTQTRVNAALQNLSVRGHTFNIQTVNYTINSDQNNIKDLSHIAKWHAVLFGKVLPWCVDNPPYTLSEYRGYLPLTLLLEYVFKSCASVYSSLINNLANRTPMSEYTFTQSRSLYNSIPKYLLDDKDKATFATLNKDYFVDKFEINQFKLEKNNTKSDIPNQLALDNSQRIDDIKNALYVIYHNDSLSKLQIPSVTSTTDTVKKLFNLNTSLFTVKPSPGASLTQGKVLPLAMSCAARNRFLSTVLNIYDWTSLNQLTNRKKLWKTAGLEMVQFFQNQSEFDLDFINQSVQLKSHWKQDYFDHRHKDSTTTKMWSFMQIAQMGTKGLDVLFKQLKLTYVDNWSSIYKEPAPNLSAVFDLNGSLNDTPKKYTELLTTKIKDIGNNTNGCNPIFKSLSFIMPTHFNEVRTLVEDLFPIIHEQKLKHDNNVSEISLYNLDINDYKECKSFLNKLETLANNKSSPLQVVVRIPAWDREAYSDLKHCELKAQYKQLQNKILDNQRQAKFAVLTKNVDLIYKDIDPSVKITEHKEILPQKWDGNDVYFPLTANNTLGIQQQLQQQVEQEYEEEQEQVQEVEQEVEQEISDYKGDESFLITRQNIDGHKDSNNIWANIPQEKKAYSGWAKRSLEQLFSLWVGSNQDATNVIRKMEPGAVKKIMENPMDFRLGLMNENLPAGFYLSYSRKDKGLILSYDEKREKDILNAIERDPSNKRSSFTVELHQPKPANVFRGDYRQFSAMSQYKVEQKLLWTYLAKEDGDQQRITNELNTLKQLHFNVNSQKSSIVMQQYTIDQKIELISEDLRTCLNTLREWARKSIPSSAMINYLFNINDINANTEKFIRAFGQLFNDHQINNCAKNQKNAGEHFIYIANQMFNAFGKDHFQTWLNRLVYPSANLTECLAKEEVDAVAVSMATLKDRAPSFKNIWWSLVNAHGRSTGHMRYAPLWAGFQKILALAEAKKLTFNEEKWVKYLNSTDNFNGSVFLNRLYKVLQHADKQLEKENIQQYILDNVDKVDWRHNGLYYATRYNEFPFWHDTLDQAEFKGVIDSKNPSYTPALDNLESYTAEQCLKQSTRYASQHMNLTITEYCNLNVLIEKSLIRSKYVEQHKNGRYGLSMLLLCLSQGSEAVKDISEDTLNRTLAAFKDVDTNLLAWMHKSFPMDNKIKHGSMDVKYAQIPVLMSAIKKAGLDKSVLNMSLDNAQNFINACGRALQCYANTELKAKWIGKDVSEEDALVALLHHRTSNPAVFNTFPWLFKQGNLLAIEREFKLVYTGSQIDLFKKQMHSIDFKQSQKLPTSDEITSLFQQFNTQYNPKAKREEFIQKQIDEGCVITFHEAEFRPLKRDELDVAMTFMEKHLKHNFKAQNLVLCQSLFAKHMAVSSSGSGQAKVIDNFLKVLTKIDNKTFYNELGQVLGMLHEFAKPKNYISLEQTTAWLNCLIDPDTIEKQHFLINVLHEVLELQVEHNEKRRQGSNLLSPNLNKLSTTIESYELSKNISSIVKSNLPNQYKPLLAKLALHGNIAVEKAKTTLTSLHALKVENEWIKGVGDIIGLMSSTDKHSLINTLSNTVLNNLGETCTTDNPAIAEFWQDSQIKLIELIKENMNTFDMSLFAAKDHQDKLVRMILLQVLDTKDYNQQKPKLEILKKQLSALDIKEREALALYCTSLPVPSLDLMIDLLTKHKSTKALIHQFETKELASFPNGVSKRNYSISDTDRLDLIRVIQGFTKKGQGLVDEAMQKKLINLLYYLNSYSQVANLGNLQFEDLTTELHRSIEVLKNPLLLDKGQYDYASARVLACMREVLLRKTGKWANHTQMLDLVYAALHNSESLLHQVKTGQGKSIISIMRVSYLALNGYVVDLFSSKDSLSKRDHKEFAHVLDAFGIANSYTTPNSHSDNYKTNDSKQKIGSVNFATIGNSSLFHSTQVWQQLKKINLDKSMRVAFIDECDHVLSDEQTQFNYTDNSGAESIYNFDEWVYRLAYDFYLERKDSFYKDEKGIMKISRNRDMKDLCDLLQKEAKFAPKDSEFFNKFIIPALSGSKEAIEKRDGQLKQILVAAHTAHGLREGIHFAIRPDQTIVGNSTVINTRFAKVMIKNQIKHGSTYSDLVHQLLHVRLNKEAIHKGESPNFFIEPDSQIAISNNAKYLLKKYYAKLEGCTGTAGNDKDLKSYDQIYDIKHVVKLPTHEALKTQFLGVVFAENMDDQIKLIAEQLQKNTNKPTLTTCKDDIEVKNIAGLVKEYIQRNSLAIDDNKIIVDTNDSGKAENDVVPLAGAVGVNTISSRMGRGTDIKPETKEGLFVLRTYPTIPRVTKQEIGRQGRNGANGQTIDIINYQEVLTDYKYYLSSPFKDKLDTILEEQTTHLQDKLDKHSILGSTKWNWIRDDKDLQNKYLITRSVQQLKHELNKQSEVFLRRKEYLIAAFSGNVMDVLHSNMNNQSFKIEKLKEQWILSRKRIEAEWNNRLAGKAGDSEEVYAEFFKKVAPIWKSLCRSYHDLNEDLCLDLETFASNMMSKMDDKNTKPEELVDRITLILENAIYQNQTIPARKIEEYKKLKKALFLKYHPDKNKSVDAEVMSRKLSNLSGLIDELTLGKRDMVNSEPSLGLTSEQGALVIAKPSRKQYGSISQRVELDTLVSYYQTWLKGAEEHYFSPDRADSKVIDTIFGGSHIHLDKLFKTINKTSTNPIGQENKIALFKAFTTLSAPQQYLIPALNMVHVMKALVSKTNHPDFENYLNCLNHFFTLDIFTNKVPRLTKPEDLLKFGRLLELMVDISFTKFIGEDNPNGNTFELISNLSQVIFDDFWDQFDDTVAQKIRKIFASNSQVTEVLTNRQLEADYHRFIECIINGKTMPDKIYEPVIKHISNNHLMLQDEYIGTLRPLFNLVLGEENIKAKEPYLPQLKVLARFDVMDQPEIWNFLAKRRPFTQEDINDLNHLFKHAKLSEELRTDMLKPLLDLPANIPVNYIIKQLQGSVSQTNNGDYKQKVKALAKMGESFNKFIRNNSNIDNKLATSELFNEYKDLAVKDNERLFSLAAKEKYSSLPLSLLKTCGKQWKTISSDTDRYFSLAVRIQNSKEPLRTLMRTNYESYVSSTNMDSLNRLDSFNKMLDDNQDLPVNALEIIYKAYQNKTIKTEDNLKDNLEVIRLMSNFDSRYSAIELNKQFINTNYSSDNVEKYRQFLSKVENLSIDKTSMGNIAAAWFSNKISKTEALDHVLDTIKEAQSLNKNQDWVSYFGTFNCAKSKQRKSIMQLLAQGILDLGKAFVEKCFAEYLNLGKRLFSVPELDERMTLQERREQISTNYRHMVSFAKEIGDVAKDSTAKGIAGNNNHLFVAHQNFFQDKSDEYLDQWFMWRSSDRKAAASELFENLATLTSKPSTDYFQQALTAIWKCQKNILANDLGTIRNGKGYSRLYDITIQLTLRVAHDFITSAVSTPAEKAWLKTLVDEQVAHQIIALRSRLESGHPVKDLLNKYSKTKMTSGSVDLELFEKELVKMDWDTVPNYLQYLVTNINCFMEINKQLPMEIHGHLLQMK